MDAFKGVFRRATQTVKEKSGKAEASGDQGLEHATKALHAFDKSGCGIAEKVLRLVKAMEDVGNLAHAIAEDYKSSVDPNVPPSDSANLALELSAWGSELSSKSQEMERQLRENAHENLLTFQRELLALKTIEEDRKKKQLEYDFFKTKVGDLCRNPPKDSTRIPRNESIRENWRRELWQATENMKNTVSNLHSGGQFALDTALYTVSVVVGNYCGYGLNGAKNHFVNARVPTKSQGPLLPPRPMSPAPQPFIPPNLQQAFPGQYGQAQPGAPGYGQPGAGQPGAPGQPQPGYGAPSQPPQQQQPPNGQFGAMPPQGQPPQQQQQPTQLNYGYAPQQQQQQQQQQQYGASPSTQPPAPVANYATNSYGQQQAPQFQQQPQQSQPAPLQPQHSSPQFAPQQQAPASQPPPPQPTAAPAPQFGQGQQVAIQQPDMKGPLAPPPSGHQDTAPPPLP